MHSYDNAYAFKLIRLLARAQVSVVANPFDNVVLQGRFDTYPKRRGITRVKELLAAGVNVALGQRARHGGRANMLYFRARQ